MNLRQLKNHLQGYGCNQIYVKSLSDNDNSKNQVYFGGSFDVLNIFPTLEIVADSSGDWASQRFKAQLDFCWLSEEGILGKAPEAKLILYPKYPEVRFSGFLKRAVNAPSSLMNIRLSGRLLFLSVSREGQVIGYVSHPDSEITREFNQETRVGEEGVFKIIALNGIQDNRRKLLNELRRIHLLGWIPAKRLNSRGEIIPYDSRNAGGYTLEAELGVTPNGISEPDYLGWEIKQYGVRSPGSAASQPITLMTPEPTGGLYVSQGVEFFIREYGYPDRSGIPDRLNFGGIHKFDELHPATNLKLVFEGFDVANGKITYTGGCFALIDLRDNIAASWSFQSLLKHWNRKHNQACYIPSLSRSNGGNYYHYLNLVMLGTGTDFTYFLREMALGNIFYDPGIKMEEASTRKRIKCRSQFRIKSGNLGGLYKRSEVVDLQAT